MSKYTLVFNPGHMKGHRVFRDDENRLVLAGWSSDHPDHTNDGPLWLDATRKGMVSLGRSAPVVVVSVPVIDRAGERTFVWTTPETVLYLFGHSGLQLNAEEDAISLRETLARLLMDQLLATREPQPQAEMDERVARQAVEDARQSLASALDNLRKVLGEPADEPCHYCDGSGKDELEKLSGRDEPCHYCKGLGRQKKSFPWIVTGVEWGKGETLQRATFHSNTTWVSVRPCDDECKGQTYLGWLLGEMALSQGARLLPGGVLEISRSMHNPAIFVPDLGRVVYGCGSWWAAIKSPEDLRKITNKNIDDVWYVRALKDLTERTACAASKPAQARKGEDQNAAPKDYTVEDQLRDQAAAPSLGASPV